MAGRLEEVHALLDQHLAGGRARREAAPTAEDQARVAAVAVLVDKLPCDRALPPSGTVPGCTAWTSRFSEPRTSAVWLTTAWLTSARTVGRRRSPRLTLQDLWLELWL